MADGDRLRSCMYAASCPSENRGQCGLQRESRLATCGISSLASHPFVAKVNSQKNLCYGMATSRRTPKRSTYKHIPHKDKPPHMVARRNARERRRVQAVNSAFARLRRHIPYENRSKRLSKVKTLQTAIEYIEHLQKLIRDYDATHTDMRTCQRANGDFRCEEISKDSAWYAYPPYVLDTNNM